MKVFEVEITYVGGGVHASEKTPGIEDLHYINRDGFACANWLSTVSGKRVSQFVPNHLVTGVFTVA